MIPSFKQAVDRLFECLGMDAVYRANGKDISVKVILKSPDQILDFRETPIHTPTHLMEIRVKDGAKPKAGDEILLDGTSYRIQGEPVQDRHHLVWKLEVLT